MAQQFSFCGCFLVAFCGLVSPKWLIQCHRQRVMRLVVMRNDRINSMVELSNIFVESAGKHVTSTFYNASQPNRGTTQNSFHHNMKH
jgi:hypothetical protein